MVLGASGKLTVRVSTFVLLETERNLRKKRPQALPAFESVRGTLASVLVNPPAELVHQLFAKVAYALEK